MMHFPSSTFHPAPGGEPVLSQSKDRFIARLASEAFLNGRQIG